MANNINRDMQELINMADFEDFYQHDDNNFGRGDGLEIDITVEVAEIREYIETLENEVDMSNIDERNPLEKAIEDTVHRISDKVVNEAQEKLGEVLPTCKEITDEFDAVASSDWEEFEWALSEMRKSLYSEFDIELIY